MTKNYYLAINLANNFQSRYPGIGTTTIPGFGIEKSGRDPGIPGFGIPGLQFLIITRPTRDLKTGKTLYGFQRFSKDSRRRAPGSSFLLHWYSWSTYDTFSEF